MYATNSTTYPDNPPKSFNEWMEHIKNVLHPIVPLNAVYLSKPVMTVRTITDKLSEGEMIYIENGKIQDCKDRPTHIITSCHGRTNGNDLSIVAMDLKSYKLTRIYI